MDSRAENGGDRAGGERASPGPAIAMSAAMALGWLAAPDVGYRDAGELGTASFVLGVPHPTGFPVDMLVLRLAAFLPLGTIAWRQNVAVALVSAGVLGLLGHLTARLAARMGLPPERGGNAGAVMAAAGLGTWMTFLGSALSVEVYSTALFLTGIAAAAALRGGRHAGLVMAVAGLAAGAHVTTGLTALVLLAAVLLERKPGRRLGFAAVRMAPAAAAALVVLYLPLASLRDPPADWGDPESVPALIGHLSAQRFRDAFRSEMLGSGGAGALAVAEQLGELRWLFAPALLGAFLSIRYRRVRPAALTALCLLALDLAYSSWINPMGAADRQVAHLAGAVTTLFAGVGTAAAVGFLGRNAAARTAASAAVLAISAALVVHTPRGQFTDRYTPGEVLGSGGPLTALPPRTVFLCRDDTSCACAMFALFAEQARPDMTVAPSQHLWDPTVLRRLAGLPQAATTGEARREMGQDEAGRRAIEMVRALVRADERGALARPVFWETNEPLMEAGFRGRTEVSEQVPFLKVRRDGRETREERDAVGEVDRLRMARLPGGRPSSNLARTTWSSAYGRVGRGLLDSGQAGQALAAMQRAVEMAPREPGAWTNLGVVLQAAGQQGAAMEAARRSILLEPGNPTPWVNLARLAAASGDLRAAREIVEMAEKLGVRDARLLGIREMLERAPAGQPDR